MLSGLHITPYPDRVRVTIAGVMKDEVYQVRKSLVPPMVSIVLPGHSWGTASGEAVVNQGPVVKLIRENIASPIKGSRIVFQLAEPADPDVSRDGDSLQVDFPTHRASSMTATTIKSVEVHPNAQGARIIVSANGWLPHDVRLIEGNRLVIDLPRVSSEAVVPEVGRKDQLIQRVRLGRHSEKVRLVVDLTEPAAYSVEPTPSGLIVHLAGTAGKTVFPKVQAQEPERLAGAGSSPETPVRSVATLGSGPRAVHAVQHPNQGTAMRPQLVQLTAAIDQKNQDEVMVDQPRFVGRRISLDFQAAEISNVLRLIAEVSGFNIVVGEGVKSKVTMKLANVPWDQALDMLLRMNGLGMMKQGNIVWVDTLMNLSKQQEEEAKAKEAKSKAEEIVTRIFYLRNIPAQEVVTSLRQYLSPRGQMQFNNASNAVIVRDIESRIGMFRQLVDGIDLQLPQVEIEARVVQANTNYTRSLGIQWGFQNVNTLGSANGVANFRAGTTGSFGQPVSDFLVNLPATVAGLQPIPAVGFQFGKTDGALLDLRLSAGEALGLTKVIASPKITTLDNREAKISQGESIPFQTVSLQGTQTTFVDANLELQVTPQITSRDPNEVTKRIMLKVRATRNAVGARSNPAGPSIDKREAQTQVLVRDGETMVIGGVYVDQQQNNVNGVPYLSRIPVLGWLFKNKVEDIARQELLIFLTPNIVKS
ncbi:MAG TPA: type IV pilus secretin PilQ [Nitrospiraceae bacterium]|nr:type IV pilus secretin PilQ [Nitrospiraceae bacterium]